MSKRTLKPIVGALSAAFLASAIVPAVSADTINPFAATELSSGYNLANFDKHAEGGCGEGKADGEGSCGEGKAKAEGKCGEGKCGADKKAEKEGKCGEGKCGADKKAKAEGSCGGDKAKAEGSCGGDKAE
ncbi:MAG: hypothetical protein V7711_14915 [Pseudomonadales bacterium]